MGIPRILSALVFVLPAATKNIPSGQRPDRYDNSVRIPAIVRWPGHIASGSTTDRTVRNIDWFPSNLAAAGVPLADATVLRGRNALPVLRDKVPADGNDDVFGLARIKTIIDPVVPAE